MDTSPASRASLTSKLSAGAITLAALVASASSGGCKSQVSVPPKYEVTDFVTGIKFTTYRDMGKETSS
ncbi:MAG TPA: hypothetical protein VFB66_29085, partial [Tepidisphaeraceae bacterium]|nr:hypothetical protein [Tepidisphaeraceae bacterium]